MLVRPTYHDNGIIVNRVFGSSLFPHLDARGNEAGQTAVISGYLRPLQIPSQVKYFVKCSTNDPWIRGTFVSNLRVKSGSNSKDNQGELIRGRPLPHFGLFRNKEASQWRLHLPFHKTAQAGPGQQQASPP